MSKKFSSSLTSDVFKILLVNMIFTIPWGLIQPFISPYFFDLTKGDYFFTGLLNGIPYITMIVSVFAFGWLVDRIGSKKVMIIGFIVFIALFVTLLFIRDPYLFFIDYVILNSLLACFYPAVMKYTSLLKGNTNIFGALGASTSFGYFIGSFVGGILYDILGMDILYILGLGTCVVGFFLTLRIRKSDYLQENDPTIVSDSHNTFTDNLRNIISISITSKIVIVLFIIASIQTFQGSFSGMFVSVYLISELGLPSSLLGLIFGIATLSGTFAAHYAGKIGEKRGYKGILLICFVGYLLVWITFHFAVNDTLFPALAYTLPIFVGLMVAGPVIITKYIPEHYRGTFMGMFAASQYLGLGMGAILGGVNAGIQQSVHANFGISASITVILILVTVFFLKIEKQQNITHPISA